MKQIISTFCVYLKTLELKTKIKLTKTINQADTLIDHSTIERTDMAKRAKQPRLMQLEEFLRKVDAHDTKFSRQQKIELGRCFLEIVMGFGDHEFVACKPHKESPDFEPSSEDLYPWALFITDKKGVEGLREEYDYRASSYLHPEQIGKKDYVVVTNGKELCVFDFKHEVAKYTVDFDKLLDGDKKASKNWQAFLNDFGVESAKGKEKERRKKALLILQTEKLNLKSLSER